jgi:hypothetical protein
MQNELLYIQRNFRTFVALQVRVFLMPIQRFTAHKRIMAIATWERVMLHPVVRGFRTAILKNEKQANPKK